MRPHQRSAFAHAKRYERYAGLLAVLLVIAIVLSSVFSRSNGAAGLATGQAMPPFAAPLAAGRLQGDVNVATHANDGAAGRRPACSVRGPEILNLCQLYESGPVVLALFIDGGSCARVLDQLQRLAPSFPQVRFAAVAIMGDRGEVRALIRSHHLSLPVGFDRDGVVAHLYKMNSCPQVSFALPGGTVQSPALVGEPRLSVLRGRVQQLVAAARARG